MQIHKYAVVALLVTALYACRQEEIVPNSIPDVQLIQGDGRSPIALSGTVSYQGYNEQSNTDDHGLRSVNYDVKGDLPSPFFEGNTTTLTCIIRSTDAGQPISTFDIEWTNTDSKHIKLSKYSITPAQGTDFTQGDWYLLAFFTTDGGASGQTFSFDAKTGRLTVLAPANRTRSIYYDHKVLNGKRLSSNGTDLGNNYGAVPGVYASDWIKLEVATNGAHTDLQLSGSLTLIPQGSLVVLEDSYDSEMSTVVRVAFGDLNTRHYAPRHGPTTPADNIIAENIMGGSREVVEDNKGYTYSELIDFSNTWIKEAGEVTFSAHESLADAGTFHFYEPEFGPNRALGAYVFTRPGQSVAERVAELKADKILNYSEINDGKFNTYTFSNSSPATYSFYSPEATNVSYTRYLWVYKTQKLAIGNKVPSSNNTFSEVHDSQNPIVFEHAYPTQWSIPSTFSEKVSKFEHIYVNVDYADSDKIWWIEGSDIYNYSALFEFIPLTLSVTENRENRGTYAYIGGNASSDLFPNSRGYQPLFPVNGCAYRLYRRITSDIHTPGTEPKKSIRPIGSGLPE